MTEITDECCDCATPAYPCMGESCPNRHVKHYICDDCKEEVDTLYEYDNSKQLCSECLIKRFEIVKEVKKYAKL